MRNPGGAKSSSPTPAHRRLPALPASSGRIPASALKTIEEMLQDVTENHGRYLDHACGGVWACPPYT
jgi:hypothetical protein